MIEMLINQHLSKDSIYEPINPDSQEGRVNERIKIKTKILFSVKGLQEVKFWLLCCLVCLSQF